MERKFGKFVANVGENAKELLEKSKDIAIQVIDQNGDGKIDLTDVSEIAESVGSTMKKSAQTLREMAGEKSRMLELKALNPIFLETLNDTEFLVSKFVRVSERDKKHADSEACKGSIGFISEQKGLRMVNIFQDSVDAFGLSFYPDCEVNFIM